MSFFSDSERESITEAIRLAELQTSGEIKVHVEEHCPIDDPIERAKEVFIFLSLDSTALKNGVLFYISIMDRQFAILGDQGINEKAGQKLWENEKELMYEHLHSGETVKGLRLAIEMAGNALKTNFPYQPGDVNELSNDISFG